MTTIQTDQYWENQDRLRHGFVDLVSTDCDRAYQWLLDAQEDERVDNKTLIWCEDYLDDYKKMAIDYINDEFATVASMHK